MSRPEIPIEKRFWAKVLKASPDECWLWVGAVSATGYGAIGLNRSTRALSAHRVAWELHNGPIPEGKFILHSCDNRRCVNPAHLRPGSQRENVADMHSRGRARSPVGERNIHAKLTWSQARAIRSEAGDRCDIAARYGVSRATVGLIKQGKIWKEAANG